MRLRPDMPENLLWPSLIDPPPDAYPLVVGAVDGDTLRIIWPYPLHMLDGIRLLEMDAPERGHNGWAQSRAKLALFLHDRPIHFYSPWDAPARRGRYGRLLAYARTPTADLGYLMIQSGFAWPYAKFGIGPMRGMYAPAYEQARDERNGLWATMEPPADVDHKRSPRVRPRPHAGALSICNRDRT